MGTVSLGWDCYRFAAAGIPNNMVYINQNGNGTVRASQLGRAAIAEFGSLQVCPCSASKALEGLGSHDQGVLQLQEAGFQIPQCHVKM